MRTAKYILIASILCVIVNTAKAEEQYWETIKRLKTDYAKAEGIPANEEAGKKLVEYINSLTKEQLMEAGRQCAEEINASFQKHGFAEGTGFVISFFIAHYPQTSGLEDLRHIFNEIEDTNRTDMWRSTLIYSFKTSVWQKKLSDNQLSEVSNALDTILASKNVHYRIVNESLYTTKATLQEIENRNKVQKSSTDDVDVNNQSDKIAEITEYYTRFSKRLINIYSEPNLNPELQMVSIALTRDILDKPLKTKKEIEVTLATAVRNFERYDEKTWKLLLQIGNENLQMPDCEQIAKQMTDKLEQRINNEPNNSLKVPLQSELRSIKHNIKKHHTNQ